MLLALIQLSGFVALLLWGTHMVTTGMLRGFGATLRQRLTQAVASPVRSFFTGVGATVALQSSTATGIMAASFTAEGVLGLRAGFLLMLGANVGTAAVARLLAFPVGQWAPMGLLLGLLAFRRGRTDRVKNMGRVAIGLGLMLLALDHLGQLWAVWLADPVVQNIEAWIFSQPGLTLVMSALVAWLCHSSLVTVLLAVAIATSTPLPPEISLALMLGANLGGAIPAVLLSSSVAARRLPLGNLAVRGCGAAIVWLTLPMWLDSLPASLISRAGWIVDAHVVFNLVLAVLMFPLAGAAAAALKRFMPDPPHPDDPGQARYLDSSIQDQSPVALSEAEREVSRLADLADQALRDAMEALRTRDEHPANRARKTVDAMTRLSRAIRHYVANIPTEELGKDDRRRAQQINRFSWDLQTMGEDIPSGLLDIVQGKHRFPMAFSSMDWKLLERAHQHVRIALKQVVAVFTTQDLRAARTLVHRKDALRKMEADIMSQPIVEPGPNTRLQSQESVLRAVRELRRLHSRLAGLAYQSLEEAGELQARLAK